MNDTCAACLDILTDSNIILLPCGHNTCRDCLLLWSRSSINPTGFQCMSCRAQLDRPFCIRNKKLLPLKMVMSTRMAMLLVKGTECIRIAILISDIYAWVILSGWMIYQFLRFASICLIPAFALNSQTISEMNAYCFAPIVLGGIEISYSSFVSHIPFPLKHDKEPSVIVRGVAVIDEELTKYCFLIFLFGFSMFTALFSYVYIDKIWHRFGIKKNGMRIIQYVIHDYFGLFY